MQVEPHIAFHGMGPSDAIRARVEKEIDKLEKFFGHITSCRVVVSKPQKRHHHGDLYAVNVHLVLPDGREVLANRNPAKDHAHEDTYVAIRDAFAAARRQLQDQARKIRGDVKRHAEPATGIVETLLAEKNYGFLRSHDGREIYFHRNSVLNDGFDKLRIGDPVTYSESDGDEGPQASMVRPTH